MQLIGEFFSFSLCGSFYAASPTPFQLDADRGAALGHVVSLGSSQLWSRKGRWQGPGAPGLRVDRQSPGRTAA